MLFSPSNSPMCHIFLILSYVYIFLSESHISLIPFSSCVSSITVSPAMPSTMFNTSSQMPSVNGWYPNNTTKQHLPLSVNVSTLLPPCCPPAASNFPHWLLTACLLPPNAGVGHSHLTPGQSSNFDQCAAHCPNKIRLWSVRHPLSKQNIIRWEFFASIGRIQFSPCQGNNSWKWLMVLVTVMANGDGNCNGRWWRKRQWPMARAMATATAMADSDATETAGAMVDGDRNCNGRQQWQWAMAMVMVTESAITTEMATAIAMAMATVRVTMAKVGLPLHVPAMCSTMAGTTHCLHPYGHKGKCIHQRCIMGVTLLRVFPPFQGGGFLTAHHGLFFCLLFTTTV
jgi:hypothetical protein